jgi:hypothetical protein
MTKELQGALTEILNGVLSAKDFMLAELPDVVQQLLLWKFYYHLSHVILGFLFVALVFFIRYKCSTLESWNPRTDDLFSYVVATVVSFFTILITFNLTWLQVWLAPKVYLIEYAASLAK